MSTSASRAPVIGLARSGVRWGVQLLKSPATGHILPDRQRLQAKSTPCDIT